MTDTPTSPVLDLIFGRCDKTDSGCWEYVRGYHLRDGYGQLTYMGKQRPTHRIVWLELHGPIEDDLVVCHTCDNPPCCNPAHLWVGTKGDNNRDREVKGRSAQNIIPGKGAEAQRSKTHCIRGHEYTDSNTYRNSAGHRICRACAHDRERLRSPRTRALKVSPEVLEGMWITASTDGKDAALELGDPKKDVLVVDGRKVAWSEKPKRVAA